MDASNKLAVAYTDKLLNQKNSAEVKWRCCCLGMECEATRFDSIEELMHHMTEQHGIGLHGLW
jgi:hypothetical protein